MYKVWEINDIRFIINEISKIWNYPCGINIEISKRVTKRMGAFFYKNTGNNIIPIKFVFSYTLINGSYPEEVKIIKWKNISIKFIAVNVRKLCVCMHGKMQQ